MSGLFERFRRDARYEYLLGDLEEEYRRRAVEHPVRARMWRWYQLIGLLWSYRSPPSPVLPARRPAPVRSAIESAWQDVRFGVRMLTRDRTVTITVVATLSLGIGATTTMFSIAHGLLRDLPFENAEALVAVDIRNREDGGDEPVYAPDLRAWRDAQSTMVDLAAVQRRGFQVSATAVRPMRYDGAAVSPWAFGLLGAEPVLGRNFTEADLKSAEPPVVISYRVWEDMFDRDPAVLGASLRVDDRVRSVVGVMGEGFAFPREEHVWIPLSIDESADSTAFEVFGRLAPHADLERASAEFAALGQRVFMASTPVREGLTVEVGPYKYRALGSDAPALLYTMVLFVSVVLLIACANVVNVLLARAAVRRREVAVRSALGGTRGRLVRQLLTETVVLAALGGLGGVVCAHLATAWFGSVLAHRINIFWVSVSIDGSVLWFTVGLTVLATVVSGLAPALVGARVDVAAAIKDGSGGVSSRSMGRVSHLLVGAEVALSCVLLVTSGLMVKGVVNLASRDLHFETAGIVTGRLQLGTFDYPDDDAVLDFYVELERSWVEAGWGEIALTSRLPGRQSGRWRFALEGASYERVQDMPTAAVRRVSAGLFPMFDLVPATGRVLDERDLVQAPPVAVVTTAFADRYYPDGAVGHRIRVGGNEATDPWREIVGVVDDHGVTLEDSRTFPGVFLPVAQSPVRTIELVVRGGGASSGDVAVGRLLDTVRAIDPTLPLYAVSSLEAVLRDEILPQQTFGRLFAGFGLAALVLAAVGLYGTMTLAVSTRAREIGLRRALGASVPRVLGQTLRAATWQLLVGLTAGLALAVLVAPAVGEFTFGTDPRDLMVFTVVPALLAATALAAAWIPARRAARIEPMQVLRYE